jgi:hypothetical protein
VRMRSRPAVGIYSSSEGAWERATNTGAALTPALSQGASVSTHRKMTANGILPPPLRGGGSGWGGKRGVAPHPRPDLPPSRGKEPLSPTEVDSSCVDTDAQEAREKARDEDLWSWPPKWRPALTPALSQGAREKAQMSIYGTCGCAGSCGSQGGAKAEHGCF